MKHDVGDQTDQDDIDALAHFVEAARELKRTAFFLEEHSRLNISWAEGDPPEAMKGEFPDPETVRSTLVPFRRIWAQSEPCYHERIANILRRYTEEYRDRLEDMQFSDKTALAGQLWEWTRNCGMTPSEVINLWLNTRYHHTGKGRKAGKFIRADFDSFNQKLGPVRNEFYFLYSVKEVGYWFFNMLGCAERFLDTLSGDGLKPTFDHSPPADDRIKRSTPGYTPDPDSPKQRVWRLRRRRFYEGINQFFEKFGFSDEAVVGAMTNCESFDDMTAACKIHIEQIGDFLAQHENQNVEYVMACLDHEFVAMKNRKARRGFLGRNKNGSLVSGENFMPVMRDQFQAFRIALQSEPFE